MSIMEASSASSKFAEACAAVNASACAAWAHTLTATVAGEDGPAYRISAASLLDLAAAIQSDIRAAAGPRAGDSAPGASPSSATPRATTLSSAHHTHAAGPAFLTLPDVSCIVPRGKFDLCFAPGYLTFTPKSTAASAAPVTVSLSHVNGIFYLPLRDRGKAVKPGDAAAELANASHIVVINLTEPVMVGKTPHTVLGIQESGVALAKAGQCTVYLGRDMPRSAVRNMDAFRELVDAATLPSTEAGAILAGTALRAPSAISMITGVLGALVGRVGGTDASVFASSQKDGYVKCYQKTSDGALFPLRRAFVFGPRPLTCIPHTEIANVAVGRTGGTVTRSFDFEISMVSGPKISFSMIDNAELDALRDYVSTRTFGRSASSAPPPVVAPAPAPPSADDQKPLEPASADDNKPHAAFAENMNDAASTDGEGADVPGEDDDDDDSSFNSDDSNLSDAWVGRRGKTRSDESSDEDAVIESSAPAQDFRTHAAHDEHAVGSGDSSEDDADAEDASEGSLADVDDMEEDELQALLAEAGDAVDDEPPVSRKRRRDA